MKPKKIFIIRHGESEGNINKNVMSLKPDYALELTAKGCEQANEAGQKLKEIIGHWDSVQFYVSPCWRARQTYLEIAKHFRYSKHYEDPRLREVDWGNLRKYNPDLEKERDSFGHFYFRIPNGESSADCFDRVSDFLNTLHRDFEKENYARNAIIVTHGLTLRLFLMRWFHLTVEEFEILANPKNCEFHILELIPGDSKYTLITSPRKYESYNHPYQFKKL